MHPETAPAQSPDLHHPGSGSVLSPIAQPNRAVGQTPALPHKSHGATTPTCDDRHPEAGLVTLELAILMVALLMLTLGGIQANFWYHGRTVAEAAAQTAAATGATGNATDADLQTEAASFVANAGGDHVLSDVTVTIGHPTPDKISVTVSGRTPRMLGNALAPSVSQTAVEPLERFTTETNP